MVLEPFDSVVCATPLDATVALGDKFTLEQLVRIVVEEMVNHPIAEFRREKGEWVFYDGQLVPQAPYVRKEAKVGRNDPCPCGSGKKYKKCCGR